MKENNVLEELFESARTEAPRITFEEVAGSFELGVSVLTSTAGLKEFLINKISLNTIIMISTTALLSTAAWFMLGTAENPIIENEPIEQEMLLVDTLNEEFEDVREVESDLKLDEKNFGSIPAVKVPELEIIKPSTNLIPETPIQTRPIQIQKTSDEIDDQDNGNGLIIMLQQSPATNANGVKFVNNNHDSSGVKLTEEIGFGSCTDEEQLKQFISTLNNFGLNATMDWDISRRKKTLKKFKLKLKHENGLDMKMKVEGFCNFTILCGLNGKSEIVQLKFKIDDQDYQEINLSSTGTYTYRSGKN